jgi:hypothetical protein
MGIWTIAMVLTEMRRLGGFYLRYRHGSKRSVIWRLSERGVAPVTPKWLTAWLQQRDVDNAQVLASGVLVLHFRDELPVLTDDIVVLIDPRKDA